MAAALVLGFAPGAMADEPQPRLVPDWECLTKPRTMANFADPCPPLEVWDTPELPPYDPDADPGPELPPYEPDADPDPGPPNDNENPADLPQWEPPTVAEPTWLDSLKEELAPLAWILDYVWTMSSNLYSPGGSPLSWTYWGASTQNNLNQAAQGNVPLPFLDRVGQAVREAADALAGRGDPNAPGRTVQQMVPPRSPQQNPQQGNRGQ